MAKDALQGTEKYTKAHLRKKRWYQMVTCLAAVVVFCTTYALILPAITLEKQCDIPEHTHTDACYTQVMSREMTVPVCSAETLEIHQHTADCYDSDGNLTCGYANFVVHRHDSTCYDENGNLWCPLPEIDAQKHTDGQNDDVGVLVDEVGNVHGLDQDATGEEGAQHDNGNQNDQHHVLLQKLANGQFLIHLPISPLLACIIRSMIFSCVASSRVNSPTILPSHIT